LVATITTAGKIYVATGNVGTCTAEGAPTTPTISQGLSFNQATAVALH